MSGISGKLRVIAVAAAFSAAVPAGAAPFAVLYAFNGVDAAQPQSALLVDSDGAIVGTSPFGGQARKGSVFRLPAGGVAGSMQILYAFTGGADGSQPFTGLAADPAGNLFGVASAGGDSGDGTIFEILRDGSTFTFQRLYSFSGGAEGNVPVGGLTIDDVAVTSLNAPGSGLHYDVTFSATNASKADASIAAFIVTPPTNDTDKVASPVKVAIPIKVPARTEMAAISIVMSYSGKSKTLPSGKYHIDASDGKSTIAQANGPLL